MGSIYNYSGRARVYSHDTAPRQHENGPVGGKIVDLVNILRQDISVTCFWSMKNNAVEAHRVELRGQREQRRNTA